MADDTWRPFKSDDPELSGVLDRYTTDVRREIVALAGISPEKSNIFLRRVIGVGYLLHTELAEYQHRVTAAERRDMLQALRMALEATLRQAHALPGAVRREIELEARIALALSE